MLRKYSLNYCVNTSLKRISFMKYSNKNIVTINYSFMRNMGSIISAHNQLLLTSNSGFLGSKCRNKSNCPLEEKCLTPKVIYQPDVKNDVDDEYKFYHGLTESSCKESFRSHTKLFNHR